MTSPAADFQRILLEALVIVALGALLGLTFNYHLVMDLFTGRIQAPQVADRSAAQSAFPQPVTLTEVRELLRQDALPVDARAAELYAEGHLPDARSLPLGAPESTMESFSAVVPTDRVLVVYCSGYGCPDSFDLAQQLIDAGYRNVRIFEGGFPEWRDAGLPVEGGP